MRKVLLVCCIAVLAAGCQTVTRSMSYGSGLADAKFSVNGRMFTAWVHPSDNDLLIETTVGAAAGRGIIQGLTFGIAEMKIPYADWEAAAKWLVEPVGCKVLRVYPLDQTTTWEAVYECPPGVDLRALINANRDKLRRGIQLTR